MLGCLIASCRAPGFVQCFAVTILKVLVNLEPGFPAPSLVSCTQTMSLMSAGHAPGLATPEEASPLTVQEARGCQASACPAPTGNSLTVQAADLPVLFPEK